MCGDIVLKVLKKIIIFIDCPIQDIQSIKIFSEKKRIIRIFTNNNFINGLLRSLSLNLLINLNNTIPSF